VTVAENVPSVHFTLGLTFPLYFVTSVVSPAGTTGGSSISAIIGTGFTEVTFTNYPSFTPGAVTSSTANGAFRAGSSISIQVTFSGPVTVTGTPQLALNSGGYGQLQLGVGHSNADLHLHRRRR
jgi:hypothetical protein